MNNRDEQQFLEFYDQYVDKIYRYIFFRVGSEELAKDLTSDAFLKSWQYLNKEQEAVNGKQPKGQKQLDNPRAFIYQVARNLIADNYRQKDRAPISLEEIADKRIADKTDGPVEQVMLSLEIESVKSALSCLSEDYQEIIIWRYLDELEVKEIAEILEKSEGAVRTLLSRALANLKKVLK